MSRRPLALGAAAVALYTLMIAAADGITKLIAGGYAPPQLFCLSALIVVIFSLLVGQKHGGLSSVLTTACRGAMLARSALTVLASVAFFYAFRYLPFADVFLFLAMVPVIAALMSGPVLGEPIRPAAWGAVLIGAGGVVCMVPGGVSALQVGHFWAALAVLAGTGSLIAARYIGRHESNTLAQVFYPNLALFAVMGLALPFVWRPMSAADLGFVMAYAAVLFAARWVVTVAMRLLPAYVATPLMNLQFVWMVAIGYLAFGEVPKAGTLLGVTLVVGSELWLLRVQSPPAPIVPPRRSVLT